MQTHQRSSNLGIATSTTTTYLDERFLQIGVKESQVDGIPIYLGFSLSLLIGLELTAAGKSANKQASAKWQLTLGFEAS